MPLSEGCSEPFPDLGHPRIKARLRLPGDYRSLATSFIGSRCLGILTCTHGSLTKFFTRDRLARRFSLTPSCQRPVGLRRSHRNQASAQSGTRISAPPAAVNAALFTPRKPLGLQHANPRLLRSHRQYGRPKGRPHQPHRIARARSRRPQEPFTAPRWRRSDSNRRPPGCKPGALPVELRPRVRARLHRSPRIPKGHAAHDVGLGGLEPPTLRLSGVRSNHLSYRPRRCLPASLKESDSPTEHVVTL